MSVPIVAKQVSMSRSNGAAAAEIVMAVMTRIVAPVARHAYGPAGGRGGSRADAPYKPDARHPGLVEAARGLAPRQMCR